MNAASVSSGDTLGYVGKELAAIAKNAADAAQCLGAQRKSDHKIRQPKKPLAQKDEKTMKSYLELKTAAMEAIARAARYDKALTVSPMLLVEIASLAVDLYYAGANDAHEARKSLDERYSK